MDIGPLSLSMRQHIKNSQDFFKEKAKEGWQFTCFGWLSPDDIKESGLYYKLKEKEWVIPVYPKFAEETKNGWNKGDKYFAPSEQFFKWLKKHYTSEPKTVDDDIDKQIQAERAHEVNPEIKKVLQDYKNYEQREKEFDVNDVDFKS